MDLGKWRNFQNILTLLSLGLLVYCFWGMIDMGSSQDKKISDKGRLKSGISKPTKTIKQKIGLINNKVMGSIRAGRNPVEMKKGTAVYYYYVIKQKR